MRCSSEIKCREEKSRKKVKEFLERRRVGKERERKGKRTRTRRRKRKRKRGYGRKRKRKREERI